MMYDLYINISFFGMTCKQKSSMALYKMTIGEVFGESRRGKNMNKNEYEEYHKSTKQILASQTILTQAITKGNKITFNEFKIQASQPNLLTK